MFGAVFGALLTIGAALGVGRLMTRRFEVPAAIAFACGAALLHLIIFAMMLANGARVPLLLILCGVATLLLIPGIGSLKKPRLPPLWITAIAGVFSVLYAANALAPEKEADANAYHLLPAIEAERSGGFTREITFYDRLPQAVELLFIPAHAAGRAPAAKLLHLGFLFWTLPLIVSIGRKLNVPDPLPSIAAALYFVTPVVGVSSSSAFNDAALVFYALATVWTLLVLRDTHSRGLAVLAGLFAGMCYAVKMSGGIAIVVTAAFLVSIQRWRALAPFCAGTALMTMPWLIRNWIETGNPFAPFFNALFPNPYFYVAPEEELGRILRTYGVTWTQRIWEVTAGFRLHGAIGPIFLLAPLALLAVRRRSVRGLILLSVVFSAASWLNAGTRFLLPALPFLCLAMVTAFGYRLAAILLIVHAVLSWPWVIPTYSPYMWRVTDFPWRVAVGLESRDTYLRRVSGDYRLALMVLEKTPPESRILDLFGLHKAHIDRRIAGSWQSTEAFRLVSALELARDLSSDPLCGWRAGFQPGPVTAVRIRQQTPLAANWSLNEVILWNNGERTTNRSSWRLTASRNSWDAPLAFDRNRTSRWSTWQKSSARDYFLIDFGGLETLDGIEVTSLCKESDARLNFEIKDPGGSWKSFAPSPSSPVKLRLRLEATRLLTRAGVTHILTPVAPKGIGVLGDSLVNDAEDWGLEIVGNRDTMYLLRVRRIP